MATVFIQKRQGKKGMRYVILYKDPLTFKSKYFKSCRKYKTAQTEVTKLRKLLDDGKAPEPAKKVQYRTFGEVAQSLEVVWKGRVKENDLSIETYEGYLLRSKILCRSFGKRLLCDLARDEIKNFRLHQYEEVSAATSNRNLFIMKQIFKHGLELKAAAIDQAKDIKYLSEKEHERKRFLTPEQIGSLVKASQLTRAKHYLPVLIYMGAEHGTSKQEALSLEWKDIDFNFQDAGIIRFHRTKNDHERTEFLMPRTRQALLDWKAHLEWMRRRQNIKVEKTSHVFCRLNGTPLKSFKKAWWNTCGFAGFDDLNYHDLRHTFCSNLILTGAGLKDVKEMIGHKDLSTTDRYSHLTALHKHKAQEKLAAHYAR